MHSLHTKNDKARRQQQRRRSQKVFLKFQIGRINRERQCISSLLCLIKKLCQNFWFSLQSQCFLGNYYKNLFLVSKMRPFGIFLNTIVRSKKSFISCYSHFTTQEIRKLVDSSIQQVLKKLVENLFFRPCCQKILNKLPQLIFWHKSWRNSQTSTSKQKTVKRNVNVYFLIMCRKLKNRRIVVGLRRM